MSASVCGGDNYESAYMIFNIVSGKLLDLKFHRPHKRLIGKYL